MEDKVGETHHRSKILLAVDNQKTHSLGILHEYILAKVVFWLSLFPVYVNKILDMMGQPCILLMW